MNELYGVSQTRDSAQYERRYPRRNAVAAATTHVESEGDTVSLASKRSAAHAEQVPSLNAARRTPHHDSDERKAKRRKWTAAGRARERQRAEDRATKMVNLEAENTQLREANVNLETENTKLHQAYVSQQREKTQLQAVYEHLRAKHLDMHCELIAALAALEQMHSRVPTPPPWFPPPL